MRGIQQCLEHVSHARGLLRLEETLRGSRIRVDQVHMRVRVAQLSQELLRGQQAGLHRLDNARAVRKGWWSRSRR